MHTLRGLSLPPCLPDMRWWWCVEERALLTAGQRSLSSSWLPFSAQRVRARIDLPNLSLHHESLDSNRAVRSAAMTRAVSLGSDMDTAQYALQVDESPGAESWSVSLSNEWDVSICLELLLTAAFLIDLPLRFWDHFPFTRENSTSSLRRFLSSVC